LEYSISASAVARGWAGYMSTLVEILFDGYKLPMWLTGQSLPDSFPHWISKWINISPLSVAIIFICTCILLGGVRDSATFNLVITVLNVTTILFVIIVGAFYVKVENLHPFFPYEWKGAFAGAGTVFFSYIGFDSVTTLAGEVRRPSRDLPIGIVGTLGIATSLYIGVSIVICGMMNYLDLSLNAPLADAFTHNHNKWASIIVSIGGVTALVASTLCSLLGQPRIYFQMAKDGLLPAKFGNVSERSGAPVFGTIVTGISASILAVLLDLNTLADMISIGTLLAFTVVCGGVIVMRCRHQDGTNPIPDNRLERIPVPLWIFVFFLDAVAVSFLVKYEVAFWIIFHTGIPMVVILVILCFRQQPGKPSTFNCPLVPVVPLVGMFVNTFLIIQLNIDSIYRVIGWTVIGMAIYFGYGIRHSRLNYAKANSGSINDITSEYVKIDSY
jgi:APA family basic amino acid/polyamine antiporter